MKILATADVHIGRRSSDGGAGADPSLLRTTEVWLDIVELAIREQVDLVLLAGDIVDRENRIYEALAPMREALHRLGEAQIPVAAVAGNHDAEVFRRVLESVGGDTFHLLGADGSWQVETFEGRGGDRIQILGWSFTSHRMESDPLETLDEGALDPDLPSLGLLHTELDASGSRYAPTKSRALRNVAVDAWVLGHVHHKRTVEDGPGPPLLYCGSPQALDPGEEGVHGVVLLEVEGRGRPSIRRVPLSRVRYETLEVDVSDVDSHGAFQGLVPAAIQRGARDFLESEEVGPLRLLSLRVRLTGRCPAFRFLPGWIEEYLGTDGEGGDRGTVIGSVRRWVERITIEARPELDLEKLAGGRNPAGVLADLLLSLESGVDLQERYGSLLRKVERRASEQAGRREYADLEEVVPDPRELLKREAWALLEELMASVEGEVDRG